MAKQIYIDENGNPIEVSGTINTAELLPISGNDPTDTKSYIDTIGTTHQLLNQALTTTNTEYSTTYSRKFSDYDLLIFRIGYGADNVRRTVVLPTNNWYSGANINEGILHGASSSHASDYDITSIVISYESDTSVKAYVGGEGLINTLKIFAIKL